MSKYKIDDTIWYANRDTRLEQVICPECFGKRFLTVILGDNSQVTIDCVGCGVGLENPKGYIEYHKHLVSVKQIIIEKVEETKLKTEYGFNGCYRVGEEDLFNTKEEAEKRALELAEEHNKEELEKINRKEKDNRTWAWNVHYHRDCIRRAEKDLIYHKTKLSVAITKTKEEKLTPRKEN